MANLSNMSPQAMAAWEALTQSWGRPLTPTSAYRDPSYNASVGGARGSQHIHGNAFDVSTAGMSPEERAALIQAAKAAGFQGFGGYDNSLHFDVGPSRTWGADYTGATTPDWLTTALGGQPTTQISTRGAPAMPMNQQPQGLFGFLAGPQSEDTRTGDQRKADVFNSLALGLNELRMNPSQALSAGIQNRMQAAREDRRTAATTNRTIEWLRTQPNGERYAQMAEAIGPNAALQAYQQAQAPRESFQTLSGQQLIDMGMQGANPNALYKVNQLTGEISQVGGSGVVVNTGNTLTPFEKGAQEFQVKMWGDLAAGAPTAQATLGQVELLDTLLKESGSGFSQGLSKFVYDTTGFDAQGSAASAANALINQLVPAQRPQGSGTMSDADLALYKGSLPQLQRSPEGNQIILDGMRAMAEYNLKVSQIGAQVLNGNMTPQEGTEAVLALGRPLESVVERIRQQSQGGTTGTGGAPIAGDVVDGYRFKGGNPADQNNWEPI